MLDRMSNQVTQVLRREQERERLARLLPGGTRERPIVVHYAAVIEPRVLNQVCPHCSGEYRIHEHERPSPGIRRVDVGCRQCSTPRTFWFRLVDHEPN
jgi:type II secretory ATPase GspE/PulE/Tfp pilus assembly ATPase PilB-like protein